MLNQEAPLDTKPDSSLLNNPDPLYDHDYCSPNKRSNQANVLKQKSCMPTTSNITTTNTTSGSYNSEATTTSEPGQKFVASTHNNARIIKTYSNEHDSSSSSSSVASSKDLVIDSYRNSLTPKDTPSIRGRKTKPNMEDPNVTVRAKRARQTTSVTDKSEWITGEDQIDSVLSEHLDQPQREKRHKPYMDPAYSQFSSSDYSSSDAESDQESECNSEDDPDKLWCVCQKPHEGKFMIRCDICMDWFHGHCVGVTKLMGDRFEKQGKEWFCSECRDRLSAGEPRHMIPKKRVKKEEKKKKQPIPGKRGRGRPRKSETIASATRSSQRTTRKSSASIDSKLVRKSFDEFEDSERLKELIKERKKEFFYKRHLAEQQKAIRRNELGLGKQSLTAYLSDSLDSLANSTNTPNMNNLPINIKSAHRDGPKIHKDKDNQKVHKEKDTQKPNIVLQINTKKDTRTVTAIVRSPKKTSTVNDLFTAEPIQINKKSDTTTTTTTTTTNNDVTARKRSNSTSSSLKNERSPTEQAETTPPKKKIKEGPTTPIESKHIAQKIKESLETRIKQIKDLNVPTDEVERLASEIEGQLNECFKEGTQKYLNKFRSLVFNLRDPKNLNLVKNVLSGEILPSRLVRMSPDEMASHELAKWRERENKHSIELIKRDAQMAAQQVIVKKTHKGEEVISAPSFNEPDDPSPESDNNQKLPPQPTTPTKQIAKDGSSDGPPIATIVVTPPPPTPVIGVINNAPSSLKMKITGISSELAPPRTRTVTPPPPLTPNVTKKEPANQELCWSGTITMPDIAKFSASVKPVSGSIDFMREEVDQNLMVCGRIAPDQVQGYIKKLKTTTKNQILIVQLFPSTVDDKSNFDVFFDYLYSRNRYGVIQTSQEILKDFYVLPIHENSSLPDILKPIKGPGIDRKEPNCLLGLLVRSKRVAQSTAVTTYTPTPINN